MQEIHFLESEWKSAPEVIFSSFGFFFCENWSIRFEKKSSSTIWVYRISLWKLRLHFKLCFPLNFFLLLYPHVIDLVRLFGALKTHFLSARITHSHTHAHTRKAQTRFPSPLSLHSIATNEAIRPNEQTFEIKREN